MMTTSMHARALASPMAKYYGGALKDIYTEIPPYTVADLQAAKTIGFGKRGAGVTPFGGGVTPFGGGVTPFGGAIHMPFGSSRLHFMRLPTKHQMGGSLWDSVKAGVKKIFSKVPESVKVAASSAVKAATPAITSAVKTQVSKGIEKLPAGLQPLATTGAQLVGQKATEYGKKLGLGVAGPPPLSKGQVDYLQKVAQAGQRSPMSMDRHEYNLLRNVAISRKLGAGMKRK